MKSIWFKMQINNLILLSKCVYEAHRGMLGWGAGFSQLLSNGISQHLNIYSITRCVISSA